MKPAVLLLADPSPCLRWLVCDELLPDAPEDERRELNDLRQSDPLVAALASRQHEDGCWEAADLGGVGTAAQTTSLALQRLGYLGLRADHEAVARGAEFLFGLQRSDGAWPLPANRAESDAREGYSMIPLQTALPLRGLAACGYATDPRAERAYDWLLAQRLEDGSWPTGRASGVHGYVAGYRRLAHSRWGCRSNTTGALACLALHPERRRGAEGRRALDLLLGRETREAHTLGFEVARLVGVEPPRGFITYYARYDLAHVLDLCWRVGATDDDPRVADLVGFVESLQGPNGLWQYDPRPQVSRWVTFDLLRSLSRLGTHGEWLGLEPRTPFQPYPRPHRRY